MTAHIPGKICQFEMSENQFERLMEAMKPVPYMIIGNTHPSSQQENANDAWKALGDEMGFVWDTARPAGSNARVFYALAKQKAEGRAE